MLSQSAGVLAWMFSRHLGIRVDRLARPAIATTATTTTAFGGSNFDHPRRLPRRGRHGSLCGGSAPRAFLTSLCSASAPAGHGTVRMSRVGCSSGAVGLGEKNCGDEDGREGEGGLTMVSSISPSAIAAFKQCPKLFFYRWEEWVFSLACGVDFRTSIITAARQAAARQDRERSSQVVMLMHLPVASTTAAVLLWPVLPEPTTSPAHQ